MVLRRSVAVAISVLVTGCGSGAPASTTPELPSAAVSPTETPVPSLLATTEVAEKAPPGAITIKVDGLKFIPDQITVEAGTVTFFLDTTRALYLHNMLIGDGPGTASAPLATSDPFETEHVVFTVHDLPPGTYEFWCSIQDHVLVGMEGTLTVTGVPG